METNEFGISKKLEAKIKMALENGPLDENDLAYFRNSAKSEGVSDADLNFFINQLSKKIGKKQSESLADAQAHYIQKQRDAIGNECPKCHRQVPPMSLECPHCGTKIVNKKSSSSIQDLLEKINSVRQRGGTAKEREQAINDTITMYPVPNTKEEVIEFLSTSISYATQRVNSSAIDHGMLKFLISVVSLGYYAMVLMMTSFNRSQKGELTEKEVRMERKKAWESKFEQVLSKGRSMQGDTEFQQQLDYYEKKFIKAKKKSNLMDNLLNYIIILILIVVAYFIIDEINPRWWRRLWR